MVAVTCRLNSVAYSLYMKDTLFDKNYLYIALLSGVFFLPFLGGVHLFDWDEINFAECSREMILRGDYLRPQINFEPFWEKPPLFFWLQSLSMHLLGINEYAARFPNAICGILTLLVVYHVGKKLYDTTFGWLWVMAYAGSILPHLYFKSGIIDPFFNLFIFLSLLYFIKSENNTPPQYKPQKDGFQNPPSVQNAWRVDNDLILGGIFSGLAVLTKGPVGLLIIGLTWFFKRLIFKELSLKTIKNITIFSFISLAITSLWFGIETLKNGFWFVQTFIEYNIRLAKTEDAGHGGFAGYHFVVLLFGCFPASIFALRSLYKRYNFMGEKVDFTRWMKVLFWVVLILFSLVQSKIVHYSSMCYLPLTFLCALTLKAILDESIAFNWIKKTILIIGILIGVLAGVLPFVGQNIELLKPFLQKDVFALKNLEATISWSVWECVLGVSYILFTFYAISMLKNLKMSLRTKVWQLRGGILLFLSTALFVNLILIFFINKIEGYSQNAAIEFYESKTVEDCYILTYNFKSYAPFFYAKKRIPINTKHSDLDWLLRGEVDKPTYWVGKYGSKNDLDTVSTLQFLYEKNGFVFYKRK
jgi:4-amino-4-deoxy-L-arabinose transferase-like glycosyltransferase